MFFGAKDLDDQVPYLICRFTVTDRRGSCYSASSQFILSKARYDADICVFGRFSLRSIGSVQRVLMGVDGEII